MRARIDNSSYVDMQPTENKNLFVLKWTPSQFKSGLHRITVKAKVRRSIAISGLIDHMNSEALAANVHCTLCNRICNRIAAALTGHCEKVQSVNKIHNAHESYYRSYNVLINSTFYARFIDDNRPQAGCLLTNLLNSPNSVNE